MIPKCLVDSCDNFIFPDEKTPLANSYATCAEHAFQVTCLSCGDYIAYGARDPDNPKKLYCPSCALTLVSKKVRNELYKVIYELDVAKTPFQTRKCRNTTCQNLFEPSSALDTICQECSDKYDSYDLGTCKECLEYLPVNNNSYCFTCSVHKNPKHKAATNIFKLNL